jgi:hypothetical protein
MACWMSQNTPADSKAKLRNDLSFGARMLRRKLLGLLSLRTLQTFTIKRKFLDKAGIVYDLGQLEVDKSSPDNW